MKRRMYDVKQGRLGGDAGTLRAAAHVSQLTSSPNWWLTELQGLLGSFASNMSAEPTRGRWEERGSSINHEKSSLSPLHDGEVKRS